MHSLLEGLPGVLCVMDDILIFGTTRKDAMVDSRQCQNVCPQLVLHLTVENVNFARPVLRSWDMSLIRGITADPNKTAAIQQMETPKSVSELRRFLGMVNQLGKFSPNIAELSKPLQELLSAKKAWLWTPTQDKDFTNLKKDLTTPNILTMYDPSALVLTQPSLPMALSMALEQFCYGKSKASGILLHTLHAQ